MTIPAIVMYPPLELLKAQNTPMKHKEMNDLTTYLMERRRALLTELAALNKLLGLHKEKVDNRQ